MQSRHPDPLRAVVFDLDATLVDHVGAATAGLHAWTAELGAPADDALVATWFALEDRHFARWRDGDISHDEQRRERLREFLPLVGRPVGSPEELDAEFAGYLAAFRAHWRAFDDALPALAAVRAAGLLTAVLTNGTEELQTDKVTRLGLGDVVGPVFTAEGLGVAKPRPEAFTAVCDHLGLAPGEVLHVGDDHAVDVLGARGAGLRAVLVDRTGTAPAGEASVVRSLAELPALLGLPSGR